jgi:predicted dehydrogenase
MIKVAIVGCGKIADDHAQQIKGIPGCEIVGVCDREELMARQLGERFDVENYFSSVNELLEKAKPEVIHITTPPQSHYELAKKCMEAGCHVYVEKPFTINAREAKELIGIAEEKELKITAGHDAQFTNAARQMREIIRKGYLGGAPVHMESYYCYNLGSEGYAKALIKDRTHWVRRLPGQLLQNIISHGICRIAEYLESDSPRVIADAFTSPFLKNMGEKDLRDELRVIINDSNHITAYFTFSSQMRPSLHHFRVYGPENGLIADHDHQTVIKMRGTNYKSYLDKFVPPLVFAKQYAFNSLNNMRRFLKNDFHMKSGMKYLINSFYKSIAKDEPPPIPYKEILLTAQIMDSIFEQIGRK